MMKISIINSNSNHSIGNLEISSDRKSLGFKKGLNVWGLYLEAIDGTFIKGPDGYYLEYDNTVNLKISNISDKFEVTVNLMEGDERWGTYRVTKSKPQSIKFRLEDVENWKNGEMIFDIISVGEPLK